MIDQHPPLRRFHVRPQGPDAPVPGDLAPDRRALREGRPTGLAFELLNEPKDAATTEVINPIFAETIRQIRRIDPKRTIFVGPGRWNSIGELPKLRLPDDDQNLIVTVHNYDPFYFTHQGADWAARTRR